MLSLSLRGKEIPDQAVVKVWILRTHCFLCSVTTVAKHFVTDLRSVDHLKGRVVYWWCKYLIRKQGSSMDTDRLSLINQEL